MSELNKAKRTVPLFTGKKARKNRKESFKKFGRDLYRNRQYYMLMAPYLIFFLTFTILPVIMSLGIFAAQAALVTRRGMRVFSINVFSSSSARAQRTPLPAMRTGFCASAIVFTASDRDASDPLEYICKGFSG